MQLQMPQMLAKRKGENISYSSFARESSPLKFLKGGPVFIPYPPFAFYITF